MSVLIIWGKFQDGSHSNMQVSKKEVKGTKGPA
jgi:hypothetical protein